MKINYLIGFQNREYRIHLKKGVFSLLLFFALVISKTTYSQAYCAAAATSAADDEIFNVTFASLNNSSTCSSLGGPGSVLNRYNNYTGITAPVVALGANYPLSVTAGQCGSSAYSGIVGVWIDYNQNGLFTDPGENVFMSAYTLFAVAGTAVSATGGITIPGTAMSGTTRMRVMQTESSTPPGPCTNPTWGEVEDYNIMILSPSPLDLGISAFLKPLTSKTCYATDTIVVRLKNFGSATADFSVDQTTVTVNTSGPNAASYSLALSSGTIASNATQDFTLSTNYNLANIGTYKLKGYTTVVGDGSVLNDTTSLTLTRSPLFTKSVFPNDSVCLNAPVQLNANYSSLKQVGTGTFTNSTTSYPTPYGNWYMGSKHQFLFLASELTAAGIISGNVNSIAFNVTNLNTAGSFINYNIAIATTTLTNLTTFQSAGFSTYFSSPSYTPTLGTNTHIFSTPFVWDGVSNIIIETCFNNNPVPFTQNVSVTQSSTPFTSSVWYNADSNPSVCTNSTSTGSMSQRPNMAFGQPTTITYSWSPANGLSATNIANPVATLSGSTTFTVEGTIGTCMTYDTVRIFIKPTPTPNLGNDSLHCTLPVIITANTIANSYLWNTGSSSSGLNVTTPGKYWVRATNTNGCTNSDTVLISLGSLPIVTLGPDTAFCQGNSINLYAGAGTGNTYLWSTGAAASSISVNTIGTYSVVVTNTIGCKASDIVNVTSKPKPTVSLVFGGVKSFCESDNVNRLLTEGSPANGVYIGAGVTTSASASYFNPTLASQGSHVIIYNYTGPNGCSNIAKDTLVVNACVGIDELTNSINLHVSPNPTTGMFVLEINSDSSIDGKFTISSIDGKLVYEDFISGDQSITKSIDITNLANGIYYLKLETKDAVKAFKVLKQ